MNVPMAAKAAKAAKAARAVMGGVFALVTICGLSIESALADHHATSGGGAKQNSVAERWTLDPAGSAVSFVTVKATDIAEAHTLSEVSGGVSFMAGGRSGDLDINLHLDSVETNIPIRNERMREFLFETSRFPTAKVHGHVAAKDYLQMPVGESVTSTLSLMLDLHGARVPVQTDVLALRLAEDRLLVTSTAPVIINASSADLVAGIDKLQKLASLPSISKAVPVSFVLTFERASN